MIKSTLEENAVPVATIQAWVMISLALAMSGLRTLCIKKEVFSNSTPSTWSSQWILIASPSTHVQAEFVL